MWKPHGIKESRPIDARNGDREGRVLFLILFNVYFGEMPERLQHNDIGCHIWTIFSVALCYVDDLSLRCPTIRGLKQKCMYGCRKQAYMHFVKYLCKIITADQKDDSDIQLKRGQFYRSVNGCKFKGTLVNGDVATRLFQTYCCSFYGS